MTSQQMYIEFNLCYDNVSSHQSPGFTEREVSVYLTRAQTLYVEQLYDVYEQSEEARKKLNSLVTYAKWFKPENPPSPNRKYEVSPKPTGLALSIYSHLYELPEDLLYTVYESIGYNVNCDKDTPVMVQPIGHDEVHSVINNRFRFNIRHALRLDIQHTINGTVHKYAEILAKKQPDYYYQRYVKRPKPIIVSNITDGPEYYIEGEYQQADCVLEPITHRPIVELAAKLAYQDYKA